MSGMTTDFSLSGGHSNYMYCITKWLPTGFWKSSVGLWWVFSATGSLKICPWSRINVVSDEECRKLMCIMGLKIKKSMLSKNRCTIDLRICSISSLRTWNEMA